MKRAIVPAQITTIEDKVAGNLSLTQVALLAVPIFGGCLIYVLLPPLMGTTGYKLALVLTGIMAGAGLALRYKGRLVGGWIVMIAKYNLRPRYYVSDKNDGFLRDEAAPLSSEVFTADLKTRPVQVLTGLSTAQTVTFEDLLTNPATSLRFETTRKGALHVSISKVE